MRAAIRAQASARTVTMPASRARPLAVSARSIHSTSAARNIPQWPNPPVPQPTVTPLDPDDPIHRSSRQGGDGKGKQSFWRQWASSPSFQAALTTVVGLGMVFGAGVGYLEWYKAHVLHRVSRFMSSANLDSANPELTKQMMRAFELGFIPLQRVDVKLMAGPGT